MAYNLYQAQLAKAWAQRVEKEQLLAERFWANHHMHGHVQHDSLPFHSGSGMHLLPRSNLKDVETCSSIAPTYVSDLTTDTSTTQILRDRLTNLEQELLREREKRVKIEEVLKELEAAHRGQEPS